MWVSKKKRRWREIQMKFKISVKLSKSIVITADRSVILSVTCRRRLNRRNTCDHTSCHFLSKQEVRGKKVLTTTMAKVAPSVPTPDSMLALPTIILQDMEAESRWAVPKSVLGDEEVLLWVLVAFSTPWVIHHSYIIQWTLTSASKPSAMVQHSGSRFRVWEPSTFWSLKELFYQLNHSRTISMNSSSFFSFSFLLLLLWWFLLEVF